jgi:nucleotide-binding universal stress UspA family protein
MKTILVPTDFSEIASNAINYAVELGEYTKSKLLLFHSYHLPVTVSDISASIILEDFQLEERSQEQMNQIAENIRKQFKSNLEIDSISFPGFALEQITNIAQKKNCNLIIMGTHGAGGLNRFLGSNTLEVIKHTPCNVLVIPAEVQFQKMDRIVFAFDYTEIKNKEVLNPLIKLASLFDSEILVFNTEDSKSKKSLEKELEGIKLENIFGNQKHSYWFSGNDNIVEAINQFALDKDAAMIVMVRRHHNLFQQIFTKSNTNEMALYSRFPLLILNE